MYNEIKQIVKESIEGINMRILFGEISSQEPIKVLIDQRFEIPGELLIFPKHMEESLELNDKLIIINSDEQYLIFDKVGDVNNGIITEKQQL